MLDVKHLCVTYHGGEQPFRAVDDVNFSVDAGEIFALVGGSGSGKSSIALAITQLLPPPMEISGHALLQGRDLLSMSSEELRAVRGGRIGYVFQEPSSSLNPVMTIGEQLAEVIECHTSVKESAITQHAVEWLERVGIERAKERLRAYPHEFSGGMQQRVMLAMALAAKPSLLIADEPTTALDVTVQVQLLRLLRTLQRELQLSIVLISHDLLIVERVATRMGVLSLGRLVEIGPVAQVLQHPTHAATQELIRARALLRLP